MRCNDASMRRCADCPSPSAASSASVRRRGCCGNGCQWRMESWGDVSLHLRAHGRTEDIDLSAASHSRIRSAKSLRLEQSAGTPCDQPATANHSPPTMDDGWDGLWSTLHEIHRTHPPGSRPCSMSTPPLGPHNVARLVRLVGLKPSRTNRAIYPPAPVSRPPPRPVSQWKW